MKLVFIGGTGRCGTNVLKKIFSKHPEVATLGFEHRFLIDPDGIIDFYVSFPQSWSPYLADKRLKRLERLLDDVCRINPFHRVVKHILSPINCDGKLISPKRYEGWELSKHFPNFDKHNQILLSKLREFVYPGVWAGSDSYTFKPRIYSSGPKTKDYLAGILGSYLRDLIDDFLRANGKGYLVEDNTWNIFFARELIELIPGAKIIHIYRDPRDVVASFVRQRWCPSDAEEAAAWYKAMMEYWFCVRRELPVNCCREIKLEALVDSPEESVRDLCEFAELPFRACLLDVDLTNAHSGRWRHEFSEDERRKISNMLNGIVTKLEYE